MKNHVPLSGLIAAPFTAFNADGSLNLKMIERQAAALVDNRVSGAFVCGTTGEGLSLTTAERQQVLEAWRAAAGSKLRLVAHVGALALEDCRSLARHAQKVGVDGFSTIAPCFYRPGRIEELVAYCAAVAEAAPELPFYFYHIPSMTNVNFSMIDFLEAAAERIPNLAGLKFTHENLMDFLACARMEGGRFEVIYGRDEALLSGLVSGARAAIGATYNFAAPLYLRLMAAFERGDLEGARQEQGRSVELIRLLQGYGFMPAAKAMMGLIGIEVGPTRLPLRSLGNEQMSSLERDLRKLGFFEWLK